MLVLDNDDRRRVIVVGSNLDVVRAIIPLLHRIDEIAVLAKTEPIRKHDWEQFTQAPRSARRTNRNKRF